MKIHNHEGKKSHLSNEDIPQTQTNFKVYKSPKKNDESLKYYSKKMKINNSTKIISFLIIISLNMQIISYINIRLIKSQSSIITLRIIGPGNKNIFCPDENAFSKIYYPNNIFINENKEISIQSTYNFTKIDNIVKLEWNSPIRNCYSMFYNCSDIIEFDFSEFNTSFVTDMSLMFSHCTSLTSLNLSNFITSRVQKIDNMFEGCLNLEYLNLENFDESSLSSDESHFSNIFNDVPDNIVICINENNINNKIFPQIKEISCYA